MRIVPVIDLMHGQVVRGIAGNRESYRPIKSRLVDGSAPAIIGTALVESFGAEEIYLADLDAIRGGEPAWETYSELANCVLSLWIDAGIGNANRAQKFANFEPGTLVPGSGRANQRVSGVIAGLESLADVNALSAILDIVGPERLIFSLDLREGRPLARFDDWQRLAPIEIARAALALGVQRMIVLDLAGVGVGAGVPTLDLCRAIRMASPEIELTSGGGVRGVEDLLALQAAGCSAALVASALHDGRITPGDVARFAP